MHEFLSLARYHAATQAIERGTQATGIRSIDSLTDTDACDGPTSRPSQVTRTATQR
jgi:hypothetical protein